MFNIENECTNNPKEFWSHLKNLGPKRQQSVPCEIYDADGNESKFCGKYLDTGFF